ncbi:transcription repressor OFP2-like [Actinidia eriantha]|uniref:transcription repressor OFP2-like n=1 Tax=Actinidia eriantha TaxID=165200 RepID=UPI00258666C8|nr:transcription repressor OFP2-like [Actinidia eriantha]
MGSHRFRLSDMIPNSWFYKLKGMGRTRNQNNNINHSRNKKQPLKQSSSSSSSSSISIPPQQFQSKTELSHHRKSYYFTRELTTPPLQPPITRHESPKITETHFPYPPRKSSKQRLTTRRKNRASSRQPPPPPRLVTATVSTSCSCRPAIDSVWAKPDSTSEEYPISPLDSSSDLQSLFPEFGSDNDSDLPKFDDFDTISQLQLPPILTKRPIKNERKNPNGSISVKVVEKEKNRFCKEQRKNPVRSPGVRIRTNSPRIAKIGGRKSVSSSSRRSLSESFAVVKSSSDPQRDFRESMVEMILEYNLKASKDLEDLLACYLLLNSDEYHDVIIEVFKQIWFDLTHVRFKN